MLNRWERMPLFWAIFALVPAASWSAEKPDAFKILGQTVEEWTHRLASSETLEEQRVAVYCLGEFGPVAGTAVPVIQKTIKKTPYFDVKWYGIEALGLIGPGATPALDDLLAILADDESDLGLRRKSLEAVARIAPEHPKVAKVVLRTVNSPVEHLSRAATDAAVTITIFNRDVEVIPILTRAARLAEHTDAATLALRCLGAEGVEPLAEVLQKGEPRARSAAAAQLARMGEAARPALAPLMKAARREHNVKVRAAILELLAGLVPGDPGLLAVAVELLGEPEGGETAAKVLAQGGKKALPQLRLGLQMRTHEARAAAARLCGELGPAAAPLMGELLPLLKDRNESVQIAAAGALGRIGPAASTALPMLQEMARRSTGQLRWVSELAAVNVARREGTPPHRSALEPLSDANVIRLLREGEPARVRIEAANVLRERENVGTAALIAALQDANLDVRVAAAKVLAIRGADAKPAVPLFISWLRVPEPKLQGAALSGLAAVGAQTPEATKAVVELALSSHAPRDEKTMELLAFALRTHGAEAAPLLARGLRSEDPEVARRAAKSLAMLGKMAVAVHADLQRAILSTDEGLVVAAVDALRRLGPVAREDVPTLLRFLTYAAPAWRSAAADALGQMDLDYAKGDPHGVIEALLPVLLDPKPEVSQSGIRALCSIGEPALPKLRWLMDINENEVPFAVLRVMARLRDRPEVVLPKITALIRPGHRPKERITAIRVLSLYAPERLEPLPILIGMLRDREDNVADAARDAVRTYGRAAVPALEKALRGRDPAIRSEALELLEELREAK